MISIKGTNATASTNPFKKKPPPRGRGCGDGNSLTSCVQCHSHIRKFYKSQLSKTDGTNLLTDVCGFVQTATTARKRKEKERAGGYKLDPGLFWVGFESVF